MLNERLSQKLKWIYLLTDWPWGMIGMLADISSSTLGPSSTGFPLLPNFDPRGRPRPRTTLTGAPLRAGVVDTGAAGGVAAGAERGGLPRRELDLVKWAATAPLTAAWELDVVCALRADLADSHCWTAVWYSVSALRSASFCDGARSSSSHSMNSSTLPRFGTWTEVVDGGGTTDLDEADPRLRFDMILSTTARRQSQLSVTSTTNLHLFYSAIQGQTSKVSHVEPMTHLKVFFQKSTCHFQEKIFICGIHTCASFYQQKSTFTNRKKLSDVS